MPTDRPHSAHWVAVFLFYLGDLEKGREVSDLYHRYEAEQASISTDRLVALYHLFRAALYAELAGSNSRGQAYWQNLIGEMERIPDDEILETRHAHLWIYQAYGHAKVGNFQEAIEPARAGRKWIERGKAIFRAPHRNSLEFALGPLLISLASHQLHPGAESRDEVQAALREYKEENVRYGRLGYPVIFDLQFSYPALLDPVLPGPDPQKD